MFEQRSCHVSVVQDEMRVVQMMMMKMVRWKVVIGVVCC